MDISKMYCKVDSPHFDEYVELTRKKFGDNCSSELVRICKRPDCLSVAIDMRAPLNTVWSSDPDHIDLIEYGYTEFTGTKKKDWTIYNNDKPLCELTDEQASELFNAWRKGWLVQSCVSGEYWWSVAEPGWLEGVIYRIKQKTDRQMFVDKCTQVMREAGTKCPDNHEYFGIIFDAGARFGSNYVDSTQYFGEGDI